MGVLNSAGGLSRVEENKTLSFLQLVHFVRNISFPKLGKLFFLQTFLGIAFVDGNLAFTNSIAKSFPSHKRPQKPLTYGTSHVFCSKSCVYPSLVPTTMMHSFLYK